MAPFLNPVNLDLIKEINRLWKPVYPYLARHIHEVFGRLDGNILEMGPFCGVIFALLRQGIGNSFSIAAFPPGMGDFFRQEARKGKMEDKIEIIETDPSLTGIEENRMDLAIFRGALFFPSLFRVDPSTPRPTGQNLLRVDPEGTFIPTAKEQGLGAVEWVNFSEIHRVLRPKGIALMGGGFGKFTPDAVIKDVGKRSRDLNLRIGKIEVNENQLRQEIEKGDVKGKVQIISEGGLWVLMRK